MNLRRLGSLILGVLLLGSFRSLLADVVYTIANLGPGLANTINSQGEVLAREVGPYRPFLYVNGQKQYLPQSFNAAALNDLGQVVGWVSTTANYVAIYSQGNLNVTNIQGTATAINNAGQIAGQGVSYGIFLYSNGVVMPIAFPGASISVLNDMNAYGELVGSAFLPDVTQGFLYSHGQFTQIPLPAEAPSNTNSSAAALNDAGQIVGTYDLFPGRAFNRLFLYSGGESRDLGSVFNSTSEIDFPLAINSAGIIVGYTLGGPRYLTAWMFRPGTGFSILNDEIDPNLGWLLQEATGINDKGEIVGDGLLQGQSHVFLLTPIPEPSTLALFGVALLGLGAWVRRHQVGRSHP